jgi:biotin operon repressor
MLKTPLGRITLEKKVKELQEQGYTIENTNLPFLKSNENVKS